MSTATMTETVDEQREALGRILGLDAPVAAEVLAAAVVDETYARNLLICRQAPELLEHLLANPPRRKEAPRALDLVAEGARALLRWGATGFSVVDDEVFRRRLEACEACPRLSAPPGGGAGILYRLAGTRGAERAVCSTCGCVVTRKARLPREACPEPHPERPRLNRWGEPAPASA